ncbi:MAG: imidazole glycerol phosphate synthase subunit HisH [Gaiellales bacterium]
MPTVLIVDYGGGNVRSLTAALERCGATVEVSADPARVERAERLMVAGQGAAGAAMGALEATGLADALRKAAGRGTPLLGVCVGLQLLFERSEEDGAACLGLVPGEVRRLTGVERLPHLGWNDVEAVADHPLTADLPAVCYFAHSYAVPADAPSALATTTVDGVAFSSIAGHGSVAGAQFHPERSSEAGRRLLARFLTWEPA